MEQTEKKKFDAKNEAFEWIEAIVVSLVAVILVFTFIFRIVSIDGNSMNNTLHDQDRVMISHLFYTPKRGDIVVLGIPNMDKPIIKRIIGMAGDRIEVDYDTDIVKVNGEMVSEPYIKEDMLPKGQVTFPIEVPEGKIFVMGDNRNDSLDSRYYEVGFVDVDDIIGQAMFRLFPFNKIGGLK